MNIPLHNSFKKFKRLTVSHISDPNWKQQKQHEKQDMTPKTPKRVNIRTWTTGTAERKPDIRRNWHPHPSGLGPYTIIAKKNTPLNDIIDKRRQESYAF